MTNRSEVYQCGVCGDMVEVVHASGGTLSCCNQSMKLLRENTTDAAKEKHVPVIEKTGQGIKVTIGSVAHPMEAKHYIEWIELIAGERVLRQFLKPGDAPSAFFEGVKAEAVAAREFCNLHGLWKV